MTNWLSSQFYFELYEAPIVIEPLVGALEINLFIRDNNKPANDASAKHKVWWQFCRVDINEETTAILPFIPTTKYPHVFTLSDDLETSPFLLVYDLTGRLSFIYKKDSALSTWICHSVTEEVRGITATHFSVRFAFNSSADRDEFSALINKITSGDVHVNASFLKAANRLLKKSNMSPVNATVAVEKEFL